MRTRRLYRSRRERQLLGVAGGIAEYLDIDPTVVRVLWVLSIFFGGLGILLYIVAAFVMPLEPVGPADPAAAAPPASPAWTAPAAQPAPTAAPAANAQPAPSAEAATAPEPTPTVEAASTAEATPTADAAPIAEPRLEDADR